MKKYVLKIFIVAFSLSLVFMFFSGRNYVVNAKNDNSINQYKKEITSIHFVRKPFYAQEYYLGQKIDLTRIADQS